MYKEKILDELVCIRLTDNIKNGKLESLNLTKNSEGDLFDKYIFQDAESRFTVHFSLNYPYKIYKSQIGTFKWDNKKYGILIPFKSLIESNQIPVNLHHADTFFLGTVNLTKDTKIKKNNILIPIPHRWVEIYLSKEIKFFYDPQYQRFSFNYLTTRNDIDFKRVRRFKVNIIKKSKKIINQ